MSETWDAAKLNRLQGCERFRSEKEQTFPSEHGGDNVRHCGIPTLGIDRHLRYVEKRSLNPILCRESFGHTRLAEAFQDRPGNRPDFELAGKSLRGLD